MMTARDAAQKKVMCNILANLYAVNSYYAYRDFKAANPKGRQYTKKGAEKPYNAYTLSPLTLEAREHYVLTQNAIWPTEKEEKIKIYLMRLRLSGELDKILEWEKKTGRKNPWRRADGETDTTGA